MKRDSNENTHKTSSTTIQMSFMSQRKNKTKEPESLREGI